MARKKVLPGDVVLFRETFEMYQNLDRLAAEYPAHSETVRGYVIQRYSKRREFDVILDFVDRLYDRERDDALSVRVRSDPFPPYPEGLSEYAQRLRDQYKIWEVLQGYPDWFVETDEMPAYGRSKMLDRETVTEARKELQKRGVIAVRRGQRCLLIRFKS